MKDKRRSLEDAAALISAGYTVGVGGNPTIDVELATVASTVILTAKEVVDRLPGPIDIPGFLTTTVVEAPGGAWPTSCFPRYPIDGEAILDYVDTVNNGNLDQILTQERAA